MLISWVTGPIIVLEMYRISWKRQPNFCPEFVFGSASAVSYQVIAAALLAVRASTCALAIVDWLSACLII